MAGLLEFLGGNDVVPRNMQQVGPAAKDVTGRAYRVYDNALPGPKGTAGVAAKVGRGGLLGALGAGVAAYDLLQGANEKYGTGAWDNAQDIANKRDVRVAIEQDPGIVQRGLDTVGRITDSAMGGVRGLMDQARAGANQDAATLPMDNAQKEKAAAVTAAPEVEAGRQRIAEGTLKGLQTGEVHVSQLAEGVVDADAQRAGKELSPEEKKAAVASEITAMKTMDKSQLSQYVSYALVAGGLLAAVFDKSGEAGRAFHDSLNKQLDRNLAAGKMAFDQQQAIAKNAREDRKVDLTETDVNSKVSDRKARQGQAERGLDQGDKRLGIMEADSRTKAFAANESAKAARDRLGLLGDANELRARDIESKIAARQAKINNPGGADKGVPLSYKDNTQLVQDVYSSQGLKADKALVSQIAGRLPTLQKKYPQLSQAELVELAAGEYDTEVDPSWVGRDDVRIRKQK